MKRTFLLSMPFAALLVLCAATAASGMYHPTLGRFVQRDPVGYAGGVNLCEYVRGAPVQRIDPYGLWGQDFHQYMTTMLAVNAGMCFPGEVGVWANAPDTGWRKAGLQGLAEIPVGGGAKLSAMQEWHFPVEPGKDQVERGSDYAAQKYRNGIQRCNLMDFAEGLHVFQDSWAHQGKPTGAGIGHSRKLASTPGPAGASTDADNVKSWPEDARAAAMATFKAMEEFMTACPCILEGPHKGEKSRCGEGKAGGVVGKWLEDQYPGENLPSVGGYEPPPDPDSWRWTPQGPPKVDLSAAFHF